jgi:hypothetical protein
VKNESNKRKEKNAKKIIQSDGQSLIGIYNFICHKCMNFITFLPTEWRFFLQKHATLQIP